MNGAQPENPIRALLAAQHVEGHLSHTTLKRLSEELRLPLHRLEELVSYYPHLRTSPPAAITVTVCRDVSCYLNGAEGLAEQIAAEVGADVAVEQVSCLGYCDLAPAVRVNDVPVRLDDLDAFVAALKQGVPAPAPAPRPPASWPLDPYDSEEERYGALLGAICVWDQHASRDGVVDELGDAGLRGMGGAGFPTGKKWDLVRNAPREPKYVVCNADESEPGTFKDRVILEDLPHLVIEGMAMDAFTVGASHGVIYLRHEYEAARRSLARELERARARKILGPGVFGPGLDFDIEIFVSPGGYILGEETALLEALEGRRGEPRNKPPYPGQAGLWGKPTLINNVETLAFAPLIAKRGADWWRNQGVGGSVGLKFVSVSGHVESPGVYQIPFGTPVRELIERAGGVSGGRALKAFAPGGASSNFLPAGAVDTPYDFGPLAEAGSMMGSGALVVVAEPTPMLPLAANLVRFFRNESCGKCVPCRVGTDKAVRLVDSALAGEGPPPRAALERLDRVLREASICGLGHVALNPLLSAARHWPEELGFAWGGEHVD